jgi:LuxR family transcriptional regulator, maltose regulon positive regulatory protein
MKPDLNDYFLLATKLTMPQSYADVLVPRLHLYDKLTSGTRAPLSIISAPAGSGKTTLLCQWLQQRTLSTPWVLLEERDNDHICFWSYILAALKKNGCEPGEPLQALLHLPLPSTHIGEDFFVALINALMTLPEDLWLVLDDFHTITSAVIHAELEFLLAHIPPRFHVILISRTVPPLPLVRLRAKGYLFELPATDLRFTFEETLLLLKQKMHETFSTNEVMALHNHTEGWIAGLQLAILSLQRTHNLTSIARFIQTFNGTNRSILNYFSEEVLAHLSDETQSFLLSTSVVKSFNASLCDALMERHDSEVMLERLEGANLFLVHMDRPIDGNTEVREIETEVHTTSTISAQSWYRYHTLFADVLTCRLRSSHPELITTLYYRACRWYEQHNMLPEAVDAALLAGEMDLAADLIEHCAWSLILQGATARITAWLTQIKGKTTTHRHRPLFCMLNAAWQLRHGNIDKFKYLLSRAEHIWQAQGNETMLHWLLGLRIYQEALYGNSKHAIVYAQEALSHAQSKHLDTAIPLISLGISYLQNGNTDKAYVMLTSGYRMSKRNKNILLITIGDFFLGEFFCSIGNLPKAAEYYQHCIEDTCSNGVCPGDDPLDCSTIAYIRQAELCYEWNDMPGAKNFLQQAMHFIEKYPHNQPGIEYYLMKAQLAWEQKATRQALEFLEQAEADALKMQHHHYSAVILLRRIRYLLSVEQQDEALVWLRQYEEHKNRPEDQSQYSLIESECYSQARARILIAAKQPVRASFLSLIKELEQGEQYAHDQGRIQSELSFLIVLAQAYHKGKDTYNVKRVLERIVAIAEAGHYMRTLLDEGDILLSLFAKVYYHPQKRVSNERQARCMTYMHTLLQTAGYLPGKGKAVIQSRADSTIEHFVHTPNPPAAVRMLSIREQEVLKLIAEGLSNQQIASTLVVAESTIKTHLNNIYTKLHVNSRLQALTRAHACGLLETH